MTYASEVLADSPLLYWRLGETSGTVAADVSGNGRTGTYTNGPTLGVAGLQSSDSDTAASFDGVNDYVSGAAPATTSAFTIEFWVQTASADPLASRRPTTTTQRIFYVARQSGKVYFTVRNAAGVEDFFTGATTLGTGPRHVACTYDGTAARIYVDGVLDGTMTTVTGALTTSAPALEIGARTAASVYSAGVFDEVALYGTALSGARIAAHFSAASPPAPITIHPAKINSTSTVRAPAIVPYVTPVDGNITITAELAPARWSAAVTEPDRSAEIQPARHTAGVQS